MKLSNAIDEMRFAMSAKDLSDNYLKKKDDLTRIDTFCGEWSYGITMVPCSFAVQLAEKLLDAVGDIEVGLDIERDVSESDSEDDGCTFTEFVA